MSREPARVVFGAVVVMASAAAAHAAAPVSTLRSIRVLDSTRFASPDPAGVFVHAETGRIVVADAEAEERPHFRTNNLFVLDAAGRLEGAYSTLAYSNEPTGVTFVPERGTYFLSDDDAFAIFEVDETFALVASFSTLPDCPDPEDLVWHPGRGTLFVAGGVANRVHEFTPEGALVSSFPTSNFGIADPEGIGYDPASDTLFAVSDPSQAVVRFTTDGRFVERIDVRPFRMTAPQGISVARASDGSGRTSLVFADGRGDNRNDGWILEAAMTFDVCGAGFDLLEPIADAYVESGPMAGANFGAQGVLCADRSPARTIYLTFELPVAFAEIASATLLLSCVDGSSAGGTAWAVPGGAIAEAALTYSNRPPTAGRALTRVTRVRAGDVAAFDVTSAAAAGSPFTIAIVGGSADEARYASREAAFARPALRIAYR